MGLVASVAAPVSAQYRWMVDTTLSLAWWQINPHLNHLWATTCPQEPSWRPGEDRFSGPRRPPTGYAAITDTVVPLYPRRWALPLCPPAVHGEVVSADTVTWSNTRGLIVVRGAALLIGQPVRDDYAQRAILNSRRYPDIRFTIDSLAEVQPGDTLHATIAGVFEFRGTRRPTTWTARAWREAGGVRVTAQFDFPPSDLSNIYGISRMALGLGVGGLIWKTVHLGVDIVLKRTE